MLGNGQTFPCIQHKNMLRLLFFCCLSPLLANAQLFRDASNQLPTTASAANMDVRAADLDADGDLDLVFAREFQANFILKNNGSAVFANGTLGNLPQVIHDSEDVAIADFNRDGHLDLVFCSEDDFSQGGTNVHEYYWGDGTGKFTAVPYRFPDSEANAVVAADINRDGSPDVVFGNKGLVHVLINKGDGTFSHEQDRVPNIVRTTQDLILFDVDGDEDDDMMVGNENGNLLLLNDGNGYFSDATSTHLPPAIAIETRKIAAGDVDMDGDMDVFLSNVAFIAGKNPQNRLYLNDGQGHFSDVTAAQLPVDSDHTIDAIFEDLDLDNDLDLVVANVFGGPLKAYLNDGRGFFADSTFAVFGKLYVRDALGVIAADLNGDGLRDLYVCHRRMPSNTQKDLLLLRQAPVATHTQGSNDRLLTVFPNPVQDHFFIKTSPDVALDSVHLSNNKGQKTALLPLKLIEKGVYRCDLPSTATGRGMWNGVCLAEGEKVGQFKMMRL